MSGTRPDPGGEAPVINQAGESRSAPVESLRALAALGVLESHVYGYEHGFGATVYSSWWHRSLLGGGYGVYLFFALTGYLLFLPFARAGLAGGTRVDLARYARNRALRILPLYYVVALVYLIVLGAPARQWVAYLTFTENFARSTVAQLDGPMWSLVVEAMFYVLLPLLALALLGGRGRSPGRSVAAVAALGAAAGAYRWWAYLHPLHPSPLVQYNLPATFYFFTPGMLLALLRVARERPGWRWPVRAAASPWAWLGAGVLCWALVFRDYRWDLLGGAGSFFLIGACVLGTPSVAVRALGWRPLAALGTASYSLYLWHMPIVGWLARRPLGGYGGHLLVALAFCVAVAAASYRLVEAPFLRLRRRWGDTAATLGTEAARPGH